MLVTLLVFFAVLTPKSLAAETNTTDETQTKNDSIVLVDGRIYGENNPLLVNVSQAYANNKLIQTPEEAAREAKLAKYKHKINPALLPQGKFIVNASAYTASADECGKSDGITASGVKVKRNRTLACPPQYPFGVKIKIDGHGTYVCEDRGGAIKGNHFDIYVESKSEAFAFGRRNLTAEIIY